MKILSDFDGVLTELGDEARRTHALFDEAVEAAARDAGVGDSGLRRLLAETEAAMTARPWRHGWRVKDRITAFADEDGFIRVNAATAALDAAADLGEEDAAKLREGLRAAGLADFRAAAQRAYLRMAEETAAGKLHPLAAESRDVLDALLTRGHDVVVVSNSSTERILKLLRGAGVPCAAHGDDARGKVRVRGDAKKFVLGDHPAITPVGDYAVETDRPHYAEILRDERPNVVIGDVFSLDLALPLALARAGGDAFRGLHAVLRRRPYTPAWSSSHVAALSDPSHRASAVDRLEQLLAKMEQSR